MKTTLVPKEHIDLVWKDIEPFAVKCAKYTYDRFSADDMLEGIKTKDQQLWIAFDNNNKIQGFWITEVLNYSQIKTLALHFMGGKDFYDWLPDGLPKLQKFARELGCSKMEAYGRPGFEKLWQNYGYKKTFVCYELPVE